MRRLLTEVKREFVRLPEEIPEHGAVAYVDDACRGFSDELRGLLLGLPGCPESFQAFKFGISAHFHNSIRLTHFLEEIVSEETYAQGLMNPYASFDLSEIEERDRSRTREIPSHVP
ncbi:hypothetical protein ACQY0O_007402 [Thecaphora frezii]